MSVADEFVLKKNDAELVIDKVGRAVAQWYEIATNIGLRKKEIDRMASAFEHTDLRQATEKLRAKQVK